MTNPLVSYQLASKYPENLRGLLDNLEGLARDPTCFEVLVKVDTEDRATQSLVAAEAQLRKCHVRAMITPRGKGYEELWIALNELFRLTNPSAYFVCNVNDEVRIRAKDWDDRLRRYVGLFPDHIFRLRTSKLKLRNYFDFWECGFAPESYAFFTKRWLDICGDWNPCFGPDSSQQYIAYYLAYANYPGIRQFNRDVPILDIGWVGEGVGRGLASEQQIQRTASNCRLGMRQVSHPMQQELFRRARLLQAHIMQAECALQCRIDIVDERSTRTVLLRDADDGQLLDLLPYKISRIRLAVRNFRRTLRYLYYAGGGPESRNLLPISILQFLILRHPRFRRLLHSCFKVVTFPLKLVIVSVGSLTNIAARRRKIKRPAKSSKMFTLLWKSARLCYRAALKIPRPLRESARFCYGAALKISRPLWESARFCYRAALKIFRPLQESARFCYGAALKISRPLWESARFCYKAVRRISRPVTWYLWS